VFERFSERARQVVVVAQEEARDLGHDYIGTEHLLIAVLREEVGVPRALLATISLTADEARAAVIAIVGRGAGPSPRQVPFTRRATRVLQLSVGEALSMGRPAAETEHLLLALIDESEGTGGRILREAGVDSWAIRAFASGETEVDFGWRGRSVALAALGAAALARSAFEPRRTGMLAPIEMQLLVYLALAARPDAGGSPGEDIDPLSVALVTDQHDVERAVASLLRHGLVVGLEGLDDDRLAITPEGMARVEQWLRRSVSLFAGWPGTVPGVDDV
jgi:Clp amino terminal domain, pathogenicity island component